ncbi:carbohydrate porin [Rhodoblastus sp. 17X3]|uniref:carbohydrate porin n=1 Tax=Rhodoblastus sp. 17X3 TaxID=3047026 RepID=UPI0024B69FA0|nr:carbohydrate porin [Rhodoblastus sp. 17X3]MDI9846463.1 carbohydrate porin [Rhodoblastus sp. 17X3]
MTRVSIAALAGSVALFMGAQAFAQQAGSDKAVATPGFGASASDLVGAQVQNSFANVGQTLYDHGVTVSSSYTAEPAGNPVGGISRGATYAGQVYFGLDIDLGKMLASQAAKDTFVHFAMVDRQGIQLSRYYIGSSIGPQEIYGIQSVHLAVFTLERKFFDDRLDVTIGRSPANIAFLDSPIYCHFMVNSTCGNPALIYFASNFSGFPSSSWGGDVKAWLTDKIYLHGGVWEVNPLDHDQAYPWGIWSTANATGAIVPFEAGYATSFKNDDLPRHYQIGGWVDRSTYTSPIYSENGGFAAINGQPYATLFGRSGVWARFDQMITRPDPHSNRGLTVFGVFMSATSGQPVMQQYYELGLLQQGTFAGRDADTLGFVVNLEKWSDNALNNVRLARATVGSFTKPPPYMVMMELNYGWQITPAVQLSPNLQAIINPDNLNEPKRASNIPSAFIVGFKLNVDLAKAAGIGAEDISRNERQLKVF